jgi:hypothetical protein
VKKALSVLLALLMVFAFIIPGCKSPAELLNEPEYRMELIEAIKAFENELGFNGTNNFLTYSEEIEVYHYYFYTSSTELPYSLDDPQLQTGMGTPESVSIDNKKYDVYFYSIPAIAGIGTPVTKSLMEEPIHRFIQIIFHEDWHEQIDLPLGIEESSGEVIGYAAARLFAENELNQYPKITDILRQHLDGRVRESSVYEYYYEQLKSTYASFHAGTISEEETIRRKGELLSSMGDELQDIWGGKPDTLNNAYIAFQMTYLRHLPLMYEALSATEFDLHKTIEIYQAMPAQGTSYSNLEQIKNVENQVVDYFQQKL